MIRLRCLRMMRELPAQHQQQQREREREASDTHTDVVMFLGWGQRGDGAIQSCSVASVEDNNRERFAGRCVGAL